MREHLPDEQDRGARSGRDPFLGRRIGRDARQPSRVDDQGDDTHIPIASVAKVLGVVLGDRECERRPVAEIAEVDAPQLEEPREPSVERTEILRRRDVVVHDDDALRALGEEAAHCDVADRDVRDEEVGGISAGAPWVIAERVHLSLERAITMRGVDLRRPDSSQESPVLERGSRNCVAGNRRDHDLVDPHQRVAMMA